jgi:hypothetical protein
VLERFVVLNKIDALYDPLATPEEVQAQIQTQREKVAETLGLPTDRVFALSAREGLAARMSGQRRQPGAQQPGRTGRRAVTRTAAAPARTAGQTPPAWS